MYLYQAYVPQIRYDKLDTPLLACNLSHFDLEYIDWQGNYLDFDLRSDTKKEVAQWRMADLDGKMFSICKVYPTQANPDPLHKVGF
jgi:hypothetical protein